MLLPQAPPPLHWSHPHTPARPHCTSPVCTPQATDDGGIAISFGNLANVDLEADCEQLYATMMKCVEEENEAADEAEAAMIGQIAGEDGLDGDGDGAGLAGMMDALPTPAFELPGPAFALPSPAFGTAAAADGDGQASRPVTPPTGGLPPVSEESEVEHPTAAANADAGAGAAAGAGVGVEDDLTPSLPAPSFSVPAAPVAPKPVSLEPTLIPVEEGPLSDPAHTSAPPGGTGSTRPATPPGAAAAAAGAAGPASPGRLSAPGMAMGGMNGTARPGGLNATARGGPLSKEAVKTLKADLARTIRTELQK